MRYIYMRSKADEAPVPA